MDCIFGGTNFKKGVDKLFLIRYYSQAYNNAGMAELADALDSGSSESNFMEVQVLLPASERTPVLISHCIEAGVRFVL